MSAPSGPTGTLPSPSANGSAPLPQSAPARRRMQTKISSMRAALIAGTAGTARITQLRRIMRRSRRQAGR